MSKPDLDITRSPEAQMFLRSVTDGFYNRSYLAHWLYEVIGREWDEMAGWSNELKQEIFVQTCTWSIAIWEWVYGFEPDENLTLQERRQRILSKIIGKRPINPEVLRRSVELMAGVKTEITDLTNPYRFGITLHSSGKVVSYEKVFKHIGEIKPAHLTFTFTVNIKSLTPAYLCINGTPGTITQMGLPQKADDFSLQDRLHIGGSFGSIQDVPVAEDRAPPSATTVLRTGGVCTILSNLSKGE